MIRVTEIGTWVMNTSSGVSCYGRIYSHDAVNDCPEAEVTNGTSPMWTGPVDTLVASYGTMASTCDLVAGTTYWISVQTSKDTNWDVKSGTGDKYYNTSWSTWPTATQWESAGTSAWEHSMYAVYQQLGHPARKRMAGVPYASTMRGVW